MKPGGGEQNLLVALRIRPLSQDELLQGASEIAYKVEDKMVVLMDPSEDPDDILRANRSRERQFVFDCAFNGSATQEDVYNTTTKFLITNVISGYNATVFAYGATGAGKTHTMLGPDNGEPGIMAHALNDLFLEMEKSKEDMAYHVSMSYLEIYNEMIRDLLRPSSGILDLREDSKGGVQVAGLSEVSTKSTTEVMDMLMKGNKERTQEPTAANKTSSRSHAVLQVTVKQRNRIRNTMQEVRVGKLFLVDLAGSERAANTHNRGKRMVEGAHINRSLLALGNCINALSDKNGAKYVNYRDSKLTRILKDALGGNCKTVMIAHISPASLNFEESRNTLVYADRAKQIKTKVRRNVTDVSYHIAQYTNIINELRDEIGRLRYKLQESNQLNKQQAVAKIHAVQSEVLEARRHDDRADLDKLREKLLTTFRDQMVFRRNLMELTNASMEISLETSRNQLIISEWDAERIKSMRRREVTDGFEGSERELEKDAELSGLDSSQSPEPEDVRIAREELRVLHEEKQRTEKLRQAVNKELETAKLRSQALEEALPRAGELGEQAEALHLLYRVHQLEISNLELQSACFIREFQVRKKDMMIARYRLHKNLCDEIIRQQRELLEEHKVACPKELEDLYELFKTEDRAGFSLQEDTEGNINLKNFSLTGASRAQIGYLEEEGTQDNLKGPVTGDTLQRSTEAFTQDDGERLFSQSRRARQIMAQEGLSIARNGRSPTPRDHLPDISPISLSPTPPAVEPKPRREERKMIVSNTRTINALAAKKRSKVQNNLVNLERQHFRERSFLQSTPEGTSTEENYLSPTSLANHNRRLGDTPNITRQPSMDSMATFSMATEASLRGRPGERYRAVRPLDRDVRRNRRGRYQDRGLYNNNSQANKTLTKKNGYKNPDLFRTKYGGMTGSDSSTDGTPPARGKHPVGRTSFYRSADISVTGLGLKQK